jgi:hypothetical protein
VSKFSASERLKWMEEERAARIAKAAALGITVAELVERNKAAAAEERRVAERRDALMKTVKLHIAECRRRGLVLPNGVTEQLWHATTRGGLREIGEDNVQALLAISGAAIDAVADVTRKLDEVEAQ